MFYFLLFFIASCWAQTFSLSRSGADSSSIFQLAFPECHSLVVTPYIGNSLDEHNRQFGQYQDAENVTHLLWGDFTSAPELDVFYEVAVDDEGAPFVEEVQVTGVKESFFGCHMIEIHDVDGNGINDLLSVVPSAFNGPLVILYRNESYDIIGNLPIFVSEWTYYGFTWGSLSLYVDVVGSTDPEILFSFGDYYFRGAWIITVSNITQNYAELYYNAVEDVEGINRYGTSITMWHDFFSDDYPEIVVGDPSLDSSFDGKVIIYSVSAIDFGDNSVTFTEYFITFDDEINGPTDNAAYNSSGFGNSVSIINTGEDIPKLAVGSIFRNYFIIITASSDLTVVSFEYYTKEKLLSRRSGFGRSVMQIPNLNSGGSIGEIIIGDLDGFCLYYLVDSGIYPVDILSSIPEFETTSILETTTIIEAVTTIIEELITTTVEDLITITVEDLITTTVEELTTEIEELTTTSERDQTTIDPKVTTSYSATTTTRIEVQSTTLQTLVTTEDAICTIVQGSCVTDEDGGQVIIKPPTNTSTGINITTDVTINNNATITGSNVTITGTISITGTLDIDSSSLDIKNKVDIGGDLNVGNSVLIFSKNGGIKTDGCVNFASDSEIKIDITDEEKKELAKNGEGFVLIESDCFEGEEKFTNGDSACEQGVKESIKVEDDKMSVIFENCLEPKYIIIIVCIIVGVVIVTVMVVFLSPLKKIIFPHRYQDRDGSKRDTVMRDSRILDRLTVMDTELRDIHNRTSNLKHELEHLDTESE